MKNYTSDYELKDLVYGVYLVNDRHVKIKIQGVIGDIVLTTVYGSALSLSYSTLEDLKDKQYKLLKPIKMNGEFEVKKYEDVYPMVLVESESNDKFYRALKEVTDNSFITLYSDESNGAEFFKAKKVKGQNY